MQTAGWLPTSIPLPQSAIIATILPTMVVNKLTQPCSHSPRHPHLPNSPRPKPENGQRFKMTVTARGWWPAAYCVFRYENYSCCSLMFQHRMTLGHVLQESGLCFPLQSQVCPGQGGTRPK